MSVSAKWSSLLKSREAEPDSRHLSTCPPLWQRGHKVCQLGFLLFWNVFSVRSQPNSCWSCSLCQNPPTSISNCHNASYLSMSKSNPASPWSPSLRPHQEVLSSIFKLPQRANSWFCWRFTKYCFPRQQWIHGAFFNTTHLVISYKRIIFNYIYM